MNRKIKPGFLNGIAANQLKNMPLLIFCLFGFSQIICAQSDYTVSPSKSNNMKLSGTATTGDWDMNAHEFTGKAQFDFMKGDNQTLTGLNSLTFSLPATNLKSDKRGLDNNAYEALKTDKHKNITYALLSAKLSPEKDGKFLIKTLGNLTISGVTREVAMDVYCMVNRDVSISCSGTEPLKMSDYKVEPPSFMFGAMKTGDAIKLDFEMLFVNTNTN